MPEVSVIIPLYNRSALLKEALDSVRAQTFSDYEIIVADDGSDSEELIRSARHCEEAGAKLVRLTHFGCPGRSRNRGVEHASGRYLAFLDSDDLWTPDKLEQQLEYMKTHPDCRLVHTREVWNREGQIVSQRKQRHQRSGEIFSDALVKCIIGPSTVMMTRECYLELGGFHDHIEVAEDYEFWLRYTALYPVGYIESPLVIKRAGNWDQLSEKYGQIEIFRIRALKHFLELPGIPEARRSEAVEEYIRKCRIFSNGCLKREKRAESLFWSREADYREKQLHAAAASGERQSLIREESCPAE